MKRKIKKLLKKQVNKINPLFLFSCIIAKFSEIYKCPLSIEIIISTHIILTKHNKASIEKKSNILKKQVK